MSDTNCAGVANSGYPLLLQKPRKNRRSYRASDVVVTLGPIHAFAGKGTPQSTQRAHVNADGS